MTFFFLLGIFVFAGAVCGVSAVSRLRILQRQIEDLSTQLSELQREINLRPKEASTPTSVSAEVPSDQQDWRDLELSSEAIADKRVESEVRPSSGPSVAPLIRYCRDNWMILLGGGFLALGGVYLVRYSIENGLLGPGARIALAAAIGLVSHAIAEYLRRRTEGSHPALAALAGSGSIILFGGVFASERLYHLIEVGPAFLLMSVIALATMVMARVHGPLLAAFGILGAYTVPALLASTDGDIRIALVYALLVSSSALLLLRYVFRRWLWWGVVAGGLAWWALSLSADLANGWRTPYLATFLYLIAALPQFDWFLRRTRFDFKIGDGWASTLGALSVRERDYLILNLLLVASVFVNVYVNPAIGSPWFQVLPFLLLSLVLSSRQEVLVWQPWLLGLSTATAWFLASLANVDGRFVLNRYEGTQALAFGGMLAVQSLAVSAFSLHAYTTRAPSAVWASLAALYPALSIPFAYLMLMRPETSLNWGLLTVMLGLAYLLGSALLVKRSGTKTLGVWLVVGGHLLVSVAVAMVFSAASLTLALAAQLLSLAWIIQRYELLDLGWLLKLVVALVVLRLSLNPWLLDYPTHIHWSLWTYGGSTLFAFWGAWLIRVSPPLSAWLQAAGLHLLVLSLWAELRYQLYDGRIYAPSFTLMEATLLMGLFASLALVYNRRAAFSASLRRFLVIYSRSLAVLALAIYTFLVLNIVNGTSWIIDSVTPTPILNLSTAAFLGPVPFALLFARYYELTFRRFALMFASVASFIALSLQVRHLWSGGVRLDYPSATAGELYTYSALWLGLAVIAIVSGAAKYGRTMYRGGLVLLSLVVVKLFVFDLSGLEGLLRVASLMGLGLSLLGISFLHRRLNVEAIR